MSRARALALCASLAAAGCVEHATDHRAGTIDDPVSISARWTLQDLAGARTACPDGFDTAVLVTERADGSARAMDRFACADGSGESRALVDGDYTAWVEIRSSDLAALYAASIPVTMTVARLRQVLSVTIVNDAGYAALGWQLVDAAGRPTDCAALAPPSAIAVHGVDTADATNVFDDQVACPPGRAVTHAVRPATYTIDVTALGGGATIGRASPVTATIGPRNAVTDLGTLPIALAPP
ncbi:MAG TPA: hypothetical protein VFP84_02255 [Kofleriaceae bacterium]|nr:hypothetical protein [Kofleriaceae bacterium]